MELLHSRLDGECDTYNFLKAGAGKSRILTIFETEEDMIVAGYLHHPFVKKDGFKLDPSPSYPMYDCNAKLISVTKRKTFG
jgi:hypothetical protein